MFGGIKIFPVLAGLLLLCIVPAQASGQSAAVPDSGMCLVILPFANNTLNSQIHEVMDILLLNSLREEGFNVVTNQDIRPVLRKHRIRSRGMIGQRAAELIASETGAKLALLGSWDILRTAGNPEIGFSMRILDLEHMDLVAAVSVGLTGEDNVGVFEKGRISAIQDLAAQALQIAFAEMFPIPTYLEPQDSWRGCFRLALIPLNNYSDTQYAGSSVSNILLTELLNRGFSVLEPGFVRELGIDREVVNRGGVDFPSAQALTTKYEVCRIVTGSVERFDSARGDPRVTVPRVSMGLRVMDPRNGRVYMMRELEGQGDQNDGFFKLGRIHSLISLSGDLLAGFANELHQSNREDIINVNR